MFASLLAWSAEIKDPDAALFKHIHKDSCSISSFL